MIPKVARIVTMETQPTAPDCEDKLYRTLLGYLANGAHESALQGQVRTVQEPVSGITKALVAEVNPSELKQNAMYMMDMVENRRNYPNMVSDELCRAVDE